MKSISFSFLLNFARFWFVLLAAEPVFAQLPQLQFEKKSLECTRLFFEQGLPQWARADQPGQNLQAFVGTFGNMLGAMKKSGAQSKPAKLALKNMEAVLKRANRLPLIARVNAALRGLQSNPDSLVLCTLLPGCKITADVPALHLYQENGPFLLRRSWGALPSSPHGIPKAEVEADPRFAIVRSQLVDRQTILINPVSSYQTVDPAISWTANLFSRLSVYANNLLYRDWIAANRKLMRNGLEADLLHQLFVKQEEGEVILEHGFYQLFNSMMVALSHYVFYVEICEPGSPFPAKGYAYDQKSALEQMRALPWVAPVLDLVKIDEANFHQVGQNIESLMLESIARANQL